MDLATTPAAARRPRLAALTGWVLRHKLLVVLAWIALAIVGFATLPRATGALSDRYTLPGRTSYEVNQEIAAAYGNGGAVHPIVAVVSLPPGARVETPGTRRELRSALRRVAAALPGARVVSYASTGNRGFVSGDGRTTFALVYPQATADGQSAASGSVDTVRRTLARTSVGGRWFRVTGVDALTDAGSSGGGPGVAAETMLGALGAILVLVFVFASFLALVPLVMAVAAIPTTFLLVWALTAVTEVSSIVQYFVALIGLGIAIDYSLLIVSRWREERARGLTNEAAVRRAMETAGRAVLVSGTTVAIGLVALVSLPVPFLRSIGYAGLLIPLTSTAVALTLLPVCLATIGPRLDWPRLRRGERPARRWMRFGRLVTRHRLVTAAVGLAVLCLLFAQAFSLKLGQAQPRSLANGGAAHAALGTLERSGVGAGVLTPIEVLTTPSAARHVAATLARVDGVRAAVAPSGPAWRRHGSALVAVLPAADPTSSAGAGTVDRVRAAVAAGSLPAHVGGWTALMDDFSSAIYGSFPLMVALIALVTFCLLARAFRSIVLPLKALALNVLSIGATWGVLVLVWQEGHGSDALWGLPATHATTMWVPLMVFAFLYGLSTDYEVFILSRMREEYDATGSTEEAVARGLGRTGRLVTSAALILFLAFVAMSSGPETDVKVLATGLGAGILLDATVVRALVLPALVAMLGRWNWWLPGRIARLLRARPASGLPVEEPSGV